MFRLENCRLAQENISCENFPDLIWSNLHCSEKACKITLYYLCNFPALWLNHIQAFLPTKNHIIAGVGWTLPMNISFKELLVCDFPYLRKSVRDWFCWVCCPFSTAHQIDYLSWDGRVEKPPQRWSGERERGERERKGDSYMWTRERMETEGDGKTRGWALGSKWA